MSQVVLPYHTESSGHYDPYYRGEYDNFSTRDLTFEGDWDGYQLSGPCTNLAVTDASLDYYDTSSDLEGVFVVARQPSTDCNDDVSPIDGHWVGYCEMHESPNGGDKMAFPIDLLITIVSQNQLAGQMKCLGCWPPEEPELTGTASEDGFTLSAQFTAKNPDVDITYNETLTLEGVSGDRQLSGRCDSVCDAQWAIDDDGNVESMYMGEFLIVWVP